MAAAAKMDTLSAHLLWRPQVSSVPIVSSAVLIVMLVVMELAGQQVSGQVSPNLTGQGHVDCQQRLMDGMYVCVSDHGIDFTVFLTLVSVSGEDNGTAASVSPNTTDSSISKDKVCGARQKIMSCVLKTAQTLVSSPSCVQPDAVGSGSVVKQDSTLKDQIFLIREQLEAIVGQYDVLCSHPCRMSLLDDMRACYTKHDVDPKLFISTEASGPVIGTTRSQVNQFCTNSDSIVRCLQKSRDDCQESHVVLSSIGLDLELMSKGVQVLCMDQETYLKSLDCFDSHTKEVEHCQSVKYRSILAMAVKAREGSWSEDRYYVEVCGAIVKHIQCDLSAWAGKGDEDCSEKTLTLKRKLHCTLIPSKCEKSHNDSVSKTCTAMKIPSAGLRPAICWSLLMATPSLFVYILRGATI